MGATNDKMNIITIGKDVERCRMGTPFLADKREQTVNKMLNCWGEE
jgi:hypothetical protein